MKTRSDLVRTVAEESAGMSASVVAEYTLSDARSIQYAKKIISGLLPACIQSRTGTPESQGTSAAMIPMAPWPPEATLWRPGVYWDGVDDSDCVCV
jgi:hypothetical protein